MTGLSKQELELSEAILTMLIDLHNDPSRASSDAFCQEVDAKIAKLDELGQEAERRGNAKRSRAT